MRDRDELSVFLRDGLAAGHSPEDLAEALRAAGWPEARIAARLAAWHHVPGLPPVPRARDTASPRDTLLHGLGFAALAMVAWQIVAIGFLFADQVTEGPGQAAGWPGAARWPVALLVVFLPIFAFLHLLPRDDSPMLRRWLAAFTGFIAAISLLGSLAAVIHAALGGDLTLRFGLKAALVALTAGLVFLTYRAALDTARPGRIGGVLLAGLGALAIAAGLWLSGGPGQGRAEMRDAERMRDLSLLAAQARCQARAGRPVPPILSTADCPAEPRLADPWSAEAYAIEVLPSDRLRLCARLERAPHWHDAEAGPGCVLVELSER